MEDWTSCSTDLLIDNIISHFTGCTAKNASVIKINSENLSVRGELYFLYNFKVWKSLLDCDKSCASILQHYAHAHCMTEDNTEEVNKIF